jgi:hypothetical protein
MGAPRVMDTVKQTYEVQDYLGAPIKRVPSISS